MSSALCFKEEQHGNALCKRCADEERGLFTMALCNVAKVRTHFLMLPLWRWSLHLFLNSLIQRIFFFFKSVAAVWYWSSFNTPPVSRSLGAEQTICFHIGRAQSQSLLMAGSLSFRWRQLCAYRQAVTYIDNHVHHLRQHLLYFLLSPSLVLCCSGTSATMAWKNGFLEKPSCSKSANKWKMSHCYKREYFLRSQLQLSFSCPDVLAYCLLACWAYLAKVQITVPRCVTLTCSDTFSYSANSCWDKRITYILHACHVWTCLTQTLLIRYRYTFIRKDVHSTAMQRCFCPHRPHVLTSSQSLVNFYCIVNLLWLCNLSSDWIGAAETSCRKPSPTVTLQCCISHKNTHWRALVTLLGQFYFG